MLGIENKINPPPPSYVKKQVPVQDVEKKQVDTEDDMAEVPNSDVTPADV